MSRAFLTFVCLVLLAVQALATVAHAVPPQCADAGMDPEHVQSMDDSFVWWDLYTGGNYFVPLRPVGLDYWTGLLVWDGICLINPDP